MAITIKYTNSLNESLTFSRDTSFKLLNFEGIGGVKTNVQSEKAPFQDGERYLDSILETRDLMLQVGIFASSPQELYERRRRFSKLFNPKLGKGVIRYTNDFLSREIECLVESGPIYPTGGNTFSSGFQVSVVNLVALNPFWVDNDFSESELVKVNPLFQFELELFSSGIEMGTYEDGKIEIENDGDVEVPLRLEFPGPVVDPIIHNETTGEFIQIKTPLLSNERMIIDTEFGRKKVEIHKIDGTIVNAFQNINFESTFFQLKPGKNILRFDASAGSEGALITLKFKKRYIGL